VVSDRLAGGALDARKGVRPNSWQSSAACI